MQIILLVLSCTGSFKDSYSIFGGCPDLLDFYVISLYLIAVTNGKHEFVPKNVISVYLIALTNGKQEFVPENVISVYLIAVTNGKHEFVPKNVFTEAEKFAKVSFVAFNTNMFCIEIVV